MDAAWLQRWVRYVSWAGAEAAGETTGQRQREGEGEGEGEAAAAAAAAAAVAPPPPGPLSSAALLGPSGLARRGLRAKKHYRGVNPSVWALYVELFGTATAPAGYRGTASAPAAAAAAAAAASSPPATVANSGGGGGGHFSRFGAAGAEETAAAQDQSAVARAAMDLYGRPVAPAVLAHVLSSPQVRAARLEGRRWRMAHGADFGAPPPGMVEDRELDEVRAAARRAADALLKAGAITAAEWRAMGEQADRGRASASSRGQRQGLREAQRAGARRAKERRARPRSGGGGGAVGVSPVSVTGAAREVAAALRAGPAALATDWSRAESGRQQASAISDGGEADPCRVQ